MSNGDNGGNLRHGVISRHQQGGGQQADGSWLQVAKAKTDENGRVRSFGADTQIKAATYKLTFDMSHYGEAGATAFFPEIDVVFRVTNPTAHHHVPVVVSPFGYSTYRGN